MNPGDSLGDFINFTLHELYLHSAWTLAAGKVEAKLEHNLFDLTIFHMNYAISDI